jgi:hypothetical protein
MINKKTTEDKLAKKTGMEREWEAYKQGREGMRDKILEYCDKNIIPSKEGEDFNSGVNAGMRYIKQFISKL